MLVLRIPKANCEVSVPGGAGAQGLQCAPESWRDRNVMAHMTASQMVPGRSVIGSETQKLLRATVGSIKNTYQRIF